MTKIGHIDAILRYPVKSMAGERLEAADLGWHGIEGDRRMALRRVQDRSGFPWLTASKLPALVLFSPQSEAGSDGELPAHIRTPKGELLPAFSAALAAEIASQYGAPVEMMQMKHGVFDDACISVIATDTIDEISRLSGISPDVRRFRPNIVVRLLQSGSFEEDKWLGGVLIFGEETDAPTVAVTMHDLRCGMVNLDPDSATPQPEVMKAIVRANENNAGIYGTVTRIGRLAIGQPVFLSRST